MSHMQRKCDDDAHYFVNITRYYREYLYRLMDPRAYSKPQNWVPSKYLSANCAQIILKSKFVQDKGNTARVERAIKRREATTHSNRLAKKRERKRKKKNPKKNWDNSRT